ncbi:MAG: ABC transporter permease [Prevotellaceae bacterium]|jgi:ABC-type antimicrobial peptide transport system permease subunit|nr:ABC transporter permease [Prevotellaceae bacterium]
MLHLTIRNLRRHNLYAWINVTGLTVGLTACILITLWVQDELSYDRFHSKAGNIYRLNYASRFFKSNEFWPVAPVPLAPAVQQTFPEVVDICRVAEYGEAAFWRYGESKYSLTGIAVDASFFTLFDFPLSEGDRRNPFPDPYSIILSETKAKALFGDRNPLGESLTTDQDIHFRITGIVKDPPAHSTLQFDYLLPTEALQHTYRGNGSWKIIHDDWGWFRCETYCLLRRGEDTQALASKISEHIAALIHKASKDDADEAGEVQECTFIFQPLTQMHLYYADGEPNGMKTVRMLALITALILLVACINYVNLVTARAVRRSKEMAVRKIMGARKPRLFFQLMQETLALLLIALAAASFLLYFLLPMYNELTGKTLEYSLADPSIWRVYAVMAASVLLLAGLYPAFLLSAFRPMDAFRSRESGRKRGTYLRKALVVLQFAVSFGLIVATLGITLQIEYMRRKDMGYDKEHIFNFSTEKMRAHYEVVRDELLRNPDILDITASEHLNMLMYTMYGSTYWEGKPDDLHLWVYITHIQPNFCDMMKIPLLRGEGLSPSDTFNLLVNEEAVRVMGMDDPIGQLVYLNKGDEQPYRIKGVVKDFHCVTLNKQIPPLLLLNILPNSTQQNGAIYVKTTGAGAQSALESIKPLWEQYNPDGEFTGWFLDDIFDKNYSKEIRMGRLLALFALIAVFISCIGLFGLVTYTAESRTKEIGIRKVFGATVGSIIAMLSKEFLWLAGIAMLLAFPIVYFWLHQLLQNYAYHIPLAWWLFAAGAAITLLLTLLSVGFKAFRAATANPVEAIKTE